MKKTKIFFFVVLAMLWTISSSAQPSNDNCAGAIDLNSSIGSYTCIQYDVDNATSSGTNGSCSFVDNDAWYTFVAIDDEMAFEYCAKQNLWNENLTLYSGNCGSLSEIQCNGLLPGFGVTYTGLTAGQTYYLLMDFDY